MAGRKTEINSGRLSISSNAKKNQIAPKEPKAVTSGSMNLKIDVSFI